MFQQWFIDAVEAVTEVLGDVVLCGGRELVIGGLRTDEPTDVTASRGP